MDAYDEWKDSDSESEAEQDAPPITYKPSYLLIAIDTHESMFSTNDSNYSSFKECLDACYQVTHSLVMAERTSIKEPVGIVVAENEAAKANLVEFEQSIPDTIQALNALKQLSNEDLKAKYMRKGDFDLADFFLMCKNKLLQVNPDVYKRTVMYITNNDDPVQNDPRKRFKIINESQKFPNIQMDLNVVTFKEDFDYENFYSEVLSASNSPPVEKVKSTVNLADKLTTLLQKRYKKYRFKLYPFKGDRDSFVEIMANKFDKGLKIAKNMYVTRDTQKEVKKSVMQQEYTGNFKCIYAKSEEPLMFNEIEKESLLETDLPVGYTLLHVGEATSKYGWVIEPAALIEKNNKETEPVFDSFWQFCKEKSRCLVCLRKLKKCGDVRLVEMVPRFVNNTRMFLATVLPFGTEIHMPSLPKQETKFHPEEEEAMKALVDVLTFDFHPSNFVDPIMGKKKAYIKSQLLEEPLEEVLDGIRPDNEMDELVALQVKDLKIVGLDDVAPTAKRGASTKRGGIQKRMKKE